MLKIVCFYLLGLYNITIIANFSLKLHLSQYFIRRLVTTIDKKQVNNTVWRNNAVKNQCRTDFNVVDEEKE
jgi:hypothetical protein